MNDNVATQFRELRESIGISVAALSRMINISESSIKRYERGEREIPEEVMERLKEISRSITVDSVQRAGERIKAYRLGLGLSGAAFAREANIKQTNLLEIENGQQMITEKTARKIEDRFEVGSDWIMYGIESEKDYPVSAKLIEWIRKDPALRKELWERMRNDAK